MKGDIRYPSKLVEMLGKTYGKFKVISTNYIPERGRYATHYLTVQCECGEFRKVRYDSLLCGDSKSCGCASSIPCGVKFPSSKISAHVMYGVYNGMKRRCYNPSSADYKHYGGRGISICDEWMEGNSQGFMNFLRDMEDTYEKGLEIERIDTNGNYSKDNCTWADRRTQTNNLRTNKLLTGYGVTLTNAEWAYLLKIENSALLNDRIHRVSTLTDDIEDLLNNVLKDRQYSIMYRGSICSAKEVFKQIGITDGQKNRLIIKHGGSIEALKALGVDFILTKEREKDYLIFDEGLVALKNDDSCFGRALFSKITSQLGGTNDI